MNIIRFIELFYVAIQKSLIEYFIKRAEKTITMKKLLKNYRNHVKLIWILIESEKKVSHSIFATLQNESSDQKTQKNKKKSEKSKKKCFCDEKHSWFKCFYLISIICSFDWTSDAIIEKKVVEKIKKNQRLTTIIENVKKQMKKNSKKKSNIEKSNLSSIIFFKNTFSSAESFAILNVFLAMQQIYKLINFWILNKNSNIHVCNNFKRFHLKRTISEKNIIIVEKTIHQIKTFKIVDIITKNFRKLISIKLLNVILIIDYFINIVCLNRFEDKGIFHDLKNDRLQRKNETFCYVKKMNRHKILKYNFSQNFQTNETSKIFVSSSTFSQILKTIETNWHNIFDHANFEILFNFEKTAENIKIIVSKSVSIIN